MEEFYSFIQGAAEWAEEESTEQWMAALHDATELYNDQKNKESVSMCECVDFNDIQTDFFKWWNQQ